MNAPSDTTSSRVDRSEYLGATRSRSRYLAVRIDPLRLARERAIRAANCEPMLYTDAVATTACRVTIASQR